MVSVVRRHTLYAGMLVAIFGLLNGSCGRPEQPVTTGFSVRMVTVGTISGRWEKAADASRYAGIVQIGHT